MYTFICKSNVNAFNDCCICVIQSMCTLGFHWIKTHWHKQVTTDDDLKYLGLTHLLTVT